MALIKWQILRFVGRLLHPDGRGTNRKLGNTLLSEFGPFAAAIYRGEDRVTGHIVLMGMRDSAELQDVLDRIQVAVAAGNSESWLRRMFENSDWRTQLVAAISVLLLDDASKYIEMLWAAVAKGSWMSPQLLVVLSIVDTKFEDHCRNRIECNCGVRSPESESLAERHRAMGPAPDYARAGKEAAAISALIQQNETIPDWLLKAKSDSTLNKIIASDIDGGDQIAIKWRKAMYDQFLACGVELPGTCA